MISHIGTSRTDTPYPTHQHQCYEITYIHDGEGYMETDKERIPFSRGSIFIVPPKLNHMLFSANGHTATSMLSRSELLAPIRSIKHARDNAEREAEILAKIMSCRGGVLNDYFQCLGKAFILLVLDFTGIDKTDHIHSETIEQIIAKINKNFSDPEFKAKSALLESPYAEDYVREMFRLQTGMTPNKMLTETRLLHAQNIILYSNSNQQISSIAHDSGFDDIAYFSKVFKKKFGMSPAEYKKKKGKTIAK